MAAVAARAGARAQLASAIMMAGGPNELAEFVLNGPRETFPTAVSPQTVIPQSNAGQSERPRGKTVSRGTLN